MGKKRTRIVICSADTFNLFQPQLAGAYVKAFSYALEFEGLSGALTHIYKYR